MNEQLHVYQFGTGEEIVIAHSIPDAIRVVMEFQGETRDLTDDLPPEEWRQEPDDKPLTIDFSGADKPEPGQYPDGATLSEDGWKVTAPAGDWATLGRQWLGSTEC